MADEFIIDAKYKRDNLVAEHERYRRRVEELEVELAAMRGVPRDDQNDDVETLPDGRGFTDELMEAQADLQSALGIARLNGWGQPQEDRVARCLACLHALLAALGRPMYDPATHPDVAYPASSASASTKPSLSGAAPKGEQEEIQARIDAEAERWSHGWRMERDGKVVPRSSPPPDRLTDEEMMALLDWRSAFDTLEDFGAARESAEESLRARLADREP